MNVGWNVVFLERRVIKCSEIAIGLSHQKFTIVIIHGTAIYTFEIVKSPEAIACRGHMQEFPVPQRCKIRLT